MLYYLDFCEKDILHKDYYFDSAITIYQLNIGDDRDDVTGTKIYTGDWVRLGADYKLRKLIQFG